MPDLFFEIPFKLLFNFLRLETKKFFHHINKIFMVLKKIKFNKII